MTENKTGRYLLFCGQQYYPGQGTEDLIGSTDELELAAATMRVWFNVEGSGTWAEIFDTQENRPVFKAIWDYSDDTWEKVDA